MIVGIANPGALEAAWSGIHAGVARAKPGLVLDGVLIEAMSDRGLEMVVGGRNDLAWGPVLLFGLGGVWIEALGDVRLTPARISRERVVDELLRLRGAALLQGFRGSLPVDLDALAEAICAVGRLLAEHPEFAEFDINPLMAFPEGRAPVALDALIVLTD